MTHEGVAALERWLATREPAPPAALAARLRELARAAEDEDCAPGVASSGASDAGASSGDGTPAAAVHAATLVQATGRVLERLLRAHETARGSALELLAADALATYAMEALGDAPDALEHRCEWAMRYFAGIADSA
ncbi:MAG: hypothetical protein IPP20_12180 [Gemmatimonadetes bacterium]|nr:hypothetical protein [Gemmatimonadota bacterium]